MADAGGAPLFVSGFLLATPPAVTATATFTSITGVLTEFDDVTDPANPVVRYNLEPRLASDIVN